MSLGDFVRLPDGRIGLIVANKTSGGVFRGHADVWFGELRDGVPVVHQLPVTADWVPLPRPMGE